MKGAEPAFDVLVIGSGLAGHISALTAAEQGLSVVMIEGDQQSASSWAQGGIVAPTVEDADALKEDLLNAGVGINNKAAIQTLVGEGARCLQKWLIDKAKVEFDPDKVLEAAHSAKRILHVKDHTGQVLMDRLREALAKEPLIQTRKGLLVDLLLSDRHDQREESQYKTSHCTGAYVFNQTSRQVEALAAKATILACGGYSALYDHSTGPRSLTGTGVAAAHRIGARTLNLEYVQFHPTALYSPGRRPQLISEALRGHGAQLLNEKLESFVDELAPRDVVARAIHSQILEQEKNHVWLDCREMDQFEERFPKISKVLTERSLDPSKDLIPIVPAAHYTLGGVWTDMKARSSVKGLMAAGEVACTGLHGANRLASTSLLEALVFAEQAGKAAGEWIQGHGAEFDFQPKQWDPGDETVDPALLKQDWDLLRKTMWNYVGLARSNARLKRASRMLSDLRSDVEGFYKKASLNESLIGLRQAVLVATLVLYAADRNKKSLGTHYRVDSRD